MFLFRSVFITALVFVSYICRVNAIILPLSRYMLDVIPADSDDADANANAVSVSDGAVSVVGHTDVPAAADSTPIPDGQEDVAQSSATESATADAEPPSSSASSSTSNLGSQANSAGPMVTIGSTSVLLGSVVAGILLTA